MGYETRLNGRIAPAEAGLVNVAEGFSPTASDFDVALLGRKSHLTPHSVPCTIKAADNALATKCSFVP